MEVIEYETPTHWEDKGMNWKTPDPTNADYVVAIREALLEWCAVLHTSADRRIHRISPWKTVSRDVMKGIVSTIFSLSRSFVNLGWEEFEEDYSDFPKMWTYGDLIQERGCRLYEYARYGSLVENGGEWLKQIRNAIDKLTVIRAGKVFGQSLSRSGSKHDPPFGESIGEAMRMAMETLHESTLNGGFPSSINAWSGNTHWKCPVPLEEGEEDWEGNVDGYCGYAESQAYRLTAAQSWLLGAQFDLFAGVIVTEPTGPVPYSQQLDTSVFDGGESRFNKGLNWTDRVHVKDPYDFEFKLGDTESIPQNGVVPSSEFDSEGIAIKRHSAKRGWIGRAYGFLDYGVEGGFKFQSQEN